jgi:hypothetical protein
MRISWRRTQVAKGEVCKTFIRRFDSGRRLFFSQQPELVLACCFFLPTARNRSPRPAERIARTSRPEGGGRDGGRPGTERLDGARWRAIPVGAFFAATNQSCSGLLLFFTHSTESKPPARRANSEDKPPGRRRQGRGTARNRATGWSEVEGDSGRRLFFSQQPELVLACCFFLPTARNRSPPSAAGQRVALNFSATS